MSKAKAPARKAEKKPVAQKKSEPCCCDEKSESCCCEEPLCALGPEELATVRELAGIATEFDLAELNVDPCGGIHIVRRHAGVSGVAVAPSVAPLPPPAPAVEKKAEKPAEVGVLITSPFVGTFYRAPAPEAPPFVDIGQAVRKGQVVCIVEAMKLMNEIESEFDGKILEILVKNAEHVEYGQPLFRIEKA